MRVGSHPTWSVSKWKAQKMTPRSGKTPVGDDVSESVERWFNWDCEGHSSPPSCVEHPESQVIRIGTYGSGAVEIRGNRCAQAAIVFGHMGTNLCLVRCTRSYSLRRIGSAIDRRASTPPVLHCEALFDKFADCPLNGFLAHRQ